jgi:hypothetical protein
MDLGANAPHGSNINHKPPQGDAGKVRKILNFVADMVQDGKRRKSVRDK